MNYQISDSCLPDLLGVCARQLDSDRAALQKLDGKRSIDRFPQCSELLAGALELTNFDRLLTA